MREMGAKGEDIARRYLRKQGYKLLARNYRAGHKEIDLIMRDGDCLVFVEVKARTPSDYGMGREAVNRKKQGNLIAAAKQYLLEAELGDCACRFDVCEVDLITGSTEHIKNAFYM